MVTDFLKIQPPVFTGEGDPMIADKWLEQVEKCLDTMNMEDDATRIRLATFQLRDSAETWWKSIKNATATTTTTTTTTATMTWKAFTELFLGQYFPRAVQDAKRKEFMDLIQGNSTVSEYEVKFTALSRFGGDTISTPHFKCRKFEEGLQLSIRPYVVAQCFSDYGQMVASALALEKERTGTDDIKDRNKIMRAGTASMASQQKGKKRT